MREFIIPDDWNSLHIAAKFGRANQIKHLIHNGVDINEKLKKIIPHCI